MPAFLKAEEIPLRGATTLPGRYYTSPEVFADEMERLFARRWLCVGREDEIAGPGDFVLRSVLGESIIVLRDRSGVVRAFYNVCRHRGTRLCEAPAGRFPATIQCPYHAWTYALDGRLVGAPSMADVEPFDKGDYPLHPAGVATWEGFVFLNLARDPQPFAEAFAPLIGKFSSYNLSTLKVARRVEYDVRANWKLIFQNYNECYHCSPVHPALVKLTPATSGANDLVEGVFLGGYMRMTGGAESMTMSGRACGLPVGDVAPDDRERVYYYSIFPNMLLSLHPDYVMAHRIRPEEPGRSHIVCEWLFHPESIGRPEWNPDDGVEFWDMTNRQDWHVCELSQLGVASRAYTPGPYSARESLPAAFDREYLRMMGEG